MANMYERHAVLNGRPPTWTWFTWQSLVAAPSSAHNSLVDYLQVISKITVKYASSFAPSSDPVLIVQATFPGLSSTLASSCVLLTCALRENRFRNHLLVIEADSDQVDR